MLFDLNMPCVLFRAGDKEYKLKLSAEASVQLEKKLGCSVFEGFKKLSEISVAVSFLWAALLRYRPDTAQKEAFLIYDDFIDGGGTLEEFAGVMAEVMTVSGFLKRKTA